MTHKSKRAQRRARHIGRADRQDYATAGEERDRLPTRDPARDPKTLSGFDPAYGHTHGSGEQARGGAFAADHDTYGRNGQPSAAPNPSDQDKNEAGYGQQFGQGFGVGPSHGPAGAGTPRERDYRGNSGTTFGAVVGPDALKPNAADDHRPDDKPA
jgi:hypothetical protein